MDPADVAAVASNVKRALKQYNTPVFDEMVQNCMAQDLSWKVRADANFSGYLKNV